MPAQQRSSRFLMLCIGVAATAPIVYRYAVHHAVYTQDIRMLYGLVADPHLLTAHVWRFAVPRLLSLSIDPHIIAGLCLIVCAFVVGLAAMRVSPQQRWLAGSAAAALVATSACTAPILAAALGFEITSSLMVLLVMALDALCIISLTPVVQSLLLLCGVVQSPLLLAPGIVYGSICIARRRGRSWVIFALPLLVGVLIRVFQNGLSMGFHITDGTVSGAAITGACVLFLALPAAVVGLKALPTQEPSSRRSVTAGVLLVISAISTAPFSGNAGLAMCWLGVLAVTFLSVLSIVPESDRRYRRYACVSAVAVFAFGVVISRALGFGGAQGSTASPTELRALLANNRGDALAGACGAANVATRYALLGEGATTFTKFAFVTGDLAKFDRPVAACVYGRHGSAETTVVQAGRFAELQAGDIAAALAFQSYDMTNRKLPFTSGHVTPRTAIKIRGHGAFLDTVATPLGSAPTITAIAGFGFRLPCTTPHPSTLTFAAANPLASDPHADPVRFTITLASPGHQYVAIARTLMPTPHVTSPTWIYYSVHLPNDTECRWLTLSASVPTPHAIATWVTFVSPALR